MSPSPFQAKLLQWRVGELRGMGVGGHKASEEVGSREAGFISLTPGDVATSYKVLPRLVSLADKG
jgi:hypothetical protein